jgi:small subunit ribosomal protein S30
MEVGSLREHLKPYIMDAVGYHLSGEKRNCLKEWRNTLRPLKNELKPERTIIENLVEDVASICMKSMSKDLPHLIEAETDFCSDVRSWWWVSGLPPPNNHPKWKARPRPNGIDQAMQYIDSNILNIRTRDPLPPILPMDDHLCTDVQLPEANYNPVSQGFKMQFRNLASIAGYWPEHDPGNDFPFLSFYSRLPVRTRESLTGYSYDDVQDFVDGMGIMSSFGWLNSLAGNHGFTAYDEMTCPLTCQTVVTDGQHWSFFVYQFNTHTFHSDVDTIQRRNVCWSTGELQLFSGIENGKMVGVNDSVLDYILKFFTRTPEPMDGVELRPYLGQVPDTRDEAKVAFDRAILRQRYGGHKTQDEHFLLQRMRIKPWERVFIKHKEGNPMVYYRNLKQFRPLTRDFNKFTI